MCQILITPRLIERKADRGCEGSKKRNKGTNEYLEGERREERGKRDALDVTSVDSVEYGIVAGSLFHHADKSRCGSHCS